MYIPEIRIIYNRLKSSAKRRHIPFELTIQDLLHLDLPITCPILNIPLIYNRGKADDNSYSIDRIDSTLGYTIDNIIVISLKANKLKNNATKDELKQIADFYQSGDDHQPL